MAKNKTIKDKTMSAEPLGDQLDAEVFEYLYLKDTAAAIAVQMKDLKERIEARITFQKPVFVEGELMLSTGMVKQVLESPKLVWAKTGKSLSAKERVIVSADVPEQYIAIDLDIKLICQNADSDADLRQVLAKFNISQEQGTRLDIKALK